MTSPASTATDGSTLRGLATLAILLHLFALVVGALMSARASSRLVRGLATDVPGVRFYNEMLYLPYSSFHLTHGYDSDWDHTVDILVDWQSGGNDEPDAPEGMKKLDLYGPQHAFPRQRLRRYQTLALLLRTTSERNATVLGRGLVRSLLAEHDIAAGNHRLRCRTEEVPPPPYFIDTDPARPNQNIVRFDIGFLDQQAELTRVGSRQESATIRRRPSGAPQKPSPQQSPPPKT